MFIGFVFVIFDWWLVVGCGGGWVGLGFDLGCFVVVFGFVFGLGLVGFAGFELVFGCVGLRVGFACYGLWVCSCFVLLIVDLFGWFDFSEWVVMIQVWVGGFWWWFGFGWVWVSYGFVLVGGMVWCLMWGGVLGCFVDLFLWVGGFTVSLLGCCFVRFYFMFITLVGFCDF